MVSGLKLDCSTRRVVCNRPYRPTERISFKWQKKCFLLASQKMDRRLLGGRSRMRTPDFPGFTRRIPKTAVKIEITDLTTAGWTWWLSSRETMHWCPWSWLVQRALCSLHLYPCPSSRGSQLSSRTRGLSGLAAAGGEKPVAL